MPFSIKLPARDASAQQEQIEFEDGASLVVVGSNGSGKSRLGAWIEKYGSNNHEIHRVGAQRRLAVPPKIALRSFDEATNLLLYGKSDRMTNSSKWGSRWAEHPTTTLLEDFAHVLSLLFASRAKRDREVVDTFKNGESISAESIPATGTEIVLDIWNDLFSHRKLEFNFESNQIRVYAEKESVSYSATEMSDGERGAIYLMGQCLSVPSKSIIIIDEPEIHLHKSILSSLWDRLELARPDCLFVYLTHDLDFAASRIGAKKIIIESFDGNHWKWRDVPSIDHLPESLVLKILGSRKPVIFVEGAEGKHDTTFYRLIYHNHLVVPLGSSRQVIEATRTLNKLLNFHHWSVYGVIDRDYRSESNLAILRNDGVYALSVAEIENLFCVEEIVKAVVSEIFPDNPTQVFARCKTIAFEFLKQELDTQIIRRTESIIEEQLERAFGGRHQTVVDLKSKLANLSGSIPIDEIFGESTSLFEQVLQNQNYQHLLAVFNQKGLLQKIACAIEPTMSQRVYIKLVLSLVDQGKISISSHLKNYVPDCMPLEYTV